MTRIITSWLPRPPLPSEQKAILRYTFMWRYHTNPSLGCRLLIMNHHNKGEQQKIAKLTFRISVFAPKIANQTHAHTKQVHLILSTAPSVAPTVEKDLKVYVSLPVYCHHAYLSFLKKTAKYNANPSSHLRRRQTWNNWKTSMLYICYLTDQISTLRHLPSIWRRLCPAEIGQAESFSVTQSRLLATPTMYSAYPKSKAVIITLRRNSFQRQAKVGFITITKFCIFPR